MTGGEDSHEESEKEGSVMPLSHIDNLDPEERAMIVGGKLEASWLDLTIRLKSALRVSPHEADPSLFFSHAPSILLFRTLASTRDMPLSFLALA